MDTPKGSMITSPWPLAAALVKAEEMIGFEPNRLWYTRNRLQDLFLERYFSLLRGKAVSLPEITSIASKRAAEINAFLRERGFTIQLEEFQPGGFGVASVLDLLEKWVVEGQKKAIREAESGREYPGVRISRRQVSFFGATGHYHPIAALKTRTDDLVMMTIAPRAPVDEFDLMSMVEDLEANRVNGEYDFEGVHFPMIDLHMEVDISWIVGMTTNGSDGEPYTISQALMEAIAKMNHAGIHMKVAVALGLEKCIIFEEPKRDMVIDGPVLLWTVRPGLTKPLAYAYIAPGDWKEPEDLEG